MSSADSAFEHGIVTIDKINLNNPVKHNYARASWLIKRMANTLKLKILIKMPR